MREKAYPRTPLLIEVISKNPPQHFLRFMKEVWNVPVNEPCVKFIYGDVEKWTEEFLESLASVDSSYAVKVQRIYREDGSVI